MQVALDAPTRPAFRYYGGKFNLAPWIISFFPEHLHYIESDSSREANKCLSMKIRLFTSKTYFYDKVNLPFIGLSK